MINKIFLILFTLTKKESCGIVFVFEMDSIKIKLGFVGLLANEAEAKAAPA